MPMATNPGAKRVTKCLERLAQGRPLSREDRETLNGTASADPVSHVLRPFGLDAAAGLEQRMALFRNAASLAPSCEVTVAGHSSRARISLEELWRFYAPLCQLLFEMCDADSGERILVGIAGPPASGKSVFAALLKRIINTSPKSLAPGAAELCAQDGFHYPNAYLESHLAADSAGKRVPLRYLKGLPETFDVSDFVKSLGLMRTERTTTLPRYDRRLHDTRPGALEIKPRHRIILVEGNHLLLEEGGWADVEPLLDLKCFLYVSLGAVRDIITQRHVRGGRSRHDALNHFNRVDRRNYRLCLESASRAELVLYRD